MMKDDDFILLRVLVTDRLSDRQTFVTVELLSQLKKKCEFSQFEGGSLMEEGVMMADWHDG